MPLLESVLSNLKLNQPLRSFLNELLLLWLVVPVVMAALYDCYTRHRYGTGMLYEAWAFNRHCTAIAGNKMNFLARLLVGSTSSW